MQVSTSLHGEVRSSWSYEVTFKEWLLQDLLVSLPQRLDITSTYVYRRKEISAIPSSERFGESAQTIRHRMDVFIAKFGFHGEGPDSRGLLPPPERVE